MKIEIDYSNIFSVIKNYILEYKIYIFSILLLLLTYVTLHQYIRGKIQMPAKIEKTYSKIDLSSDIDTLECKLKQRICYFNNIENTLEKAIENCKDIGYCDIY